MRRTPQRPAKVVKAVATRCSQRQDRAPPKAKTMTPEVNLPGVEPALARSRVCRRLPAKLRVRLDSAILLRPKNLTSPESIAAYFELAQYGISPAALRSYARRLEDLMRPVVAGQVVAAVFGCLPADYRRRLLAGTEVLLLSRVIQALSAQNAPGLSIAEMGRLGSILSALARPFRARVGAGAKPTRRLSDPERLGPLEPARIKELVRNVYGLSLPASTAPQGASTDPA